jgi:hypothetical protein
MEPSSGAAMQESETVFVYRLDKASNAVNQLGTLVERRKTDRGKNAAGMLRLARKEFAATEEESGNIFIRFG